MTSIVTLLTGLSALPVLAVVATLVALESAAFVGVVLPSEAALLIAGYLAGTGVVGAGWLTVVAVVAAVVGDSIGFALGRRYGARLESSRLGRKLGERHWGTAHRLTASRGGLGVALGRWVGILRTLVPALAGSSGMSYRRFLALDALGSVTWAATMVALGSLAGAFGGISALLGVVSNAGTALLVIGAVALLVLGLRSLRHRGSPALAA